MKVVSMRFLYFVVALMVRAQTDASAEDASMTPENMFKQTLVEHRAAPQGRNSLERWIMWKQLATNLMEASSSSLVPLEIIQALEESILVIERAVFEAGEADDPPRDEALAHLYYAYGKMLISLTAQDCTSLAMDERTLLIGAETVDASKPSQHLCLENAENALRNAATLDATHNDAAKLLAKLLQQESAEGVHKRKPKEFVAELFDSFAETFDSKLGSLGYRVPRVGGQSCCISSPYVFISTRCWCRYRSSWSILAPTRDRSSCWR